jgi:hypothetical protein
MSFFAPIAGNESFSNVNTVAGQVENLNLSNGQVVVESLNLTGLVSDSKKAPGGTVKRMIGYAPNNFAPSAASATFFLNKEPGLPPAESADYDKLFKFPVGSIPIKATITNNGTLITSAGALTADVDRQAWSATPSGAVGAGTTIFNTAIMVGTVVTSCANNSSGITVNSNVPILASALFNTAGTETITGTLAATVDGADCVSIVCSADTITAGDVSIVFEVFIPDPVA